MSIAVTIAVLAGLWLILLLPPESRRSKRETVRQDAQVERKRALMTLGSGQIGVVEVAIGPVLAYKRQAGQVLDITGPALTNSANL